MQPNGPFGSSCADIQSAVPNDACTREAHLDDLQRCICWQVCVQRHRLVFLLRTEPDVLKHEGLSGTGVSRPMQLLKTPALTIQHD